jgi:hypothetical protein
MAIIIDRPERVDRLLERIEDEIHAVLALVAPKPATPLQMNELEETLYRASTLINCALLIVRSVKEGGG